MKNTYLKIFILILCLSLCRELFAETIKTIKLKDGSILRGEVVGLKDQIYSIKTTYLGEVQVPDSEIISISSEEPTHAQPSQQNLSAGINLSSENTNLKEKVQELQGSVLSDEGVMADIANLAQDPEIMAILSDQNFVNDIMSYDPNKIGQNEKAQILMQNPKIKAMMEKVSQKTANQQ